MKTVVVTIVFRTNATEEEIKQVAEDMYVQHETLQDVKGRKVYYPDYQTMINEDYPT